MTHRSNILLKCLPLFLIVLIGYTNQLDAQNDSVNRRGIDLGKAEKNYEWGPTYALIVGISNYKNISQLNYADDDAESFRDFLLDTKIITNPNNIYFLIDSAATKTEIFRGLNNILAKLKGESNERVFIYFAGHGDTESETEQGYLLAYNCEKVAYDMTDAVYLPQFEPKVAAIAKKAKVFLITDACRSGNLAGQNNGALRTMKAINDGFANTVKILSCEPGQLSQEKPFPGGGHGVFTYYLLEALYGLGVENDVQYVEVSDIQDYINPKVYANTKKEQRPVIIGNASEIITKIDPEMKQAAIARKKMAEENPNHIVKRRDNSNNIKISADDSTYYKKFYDHLRSGRLNTPSGQNAWEIYKTARKNIKNDELMNLMRFDLAAKLEDAVQPLLNRFIRAEFQDYPDSLFADADNKLKIVMDELMDSADIRINEIKAKRIFFIASVHKSPRTLELLRTADNLLPNSTFISFELGRYFSEISKQPDSALFYLNKAIRLSPRWSYPKFIIGNMYYRNKEYSRAKIFYNNAVELQPKFAYALFNLALTYKQLKEKDSANYYYQKAVQLDKSFEAKWSSERTSQDETDIVSLGRDIRNNDRTDETLFDGLLPSIAKTNTGTLSADVKAANEFYLKAGRLYDEGNTDSAIYYYNTSAKLFEKAYKENKFDLSYFYTWGYAVQNTSDFKKAEEIFRLALEKDTADFHLYYFGIAYARDKQNDLNGSLYWYKKAVESYGNLYQAYNNLGWTYYKLKNEDSAIYFYRKALAINPRYLTTLYNIGDLFYFRLNDDSAIYYYKKVARMDASAGSNLFYRIGVSYDYLNQTDSAVTYYSKAIKINDKVSDYYYKIAALYFRVKNYKDALTYYENGNKVNNTGTPYYIDPALCYAYLGNYTTAEKLLREGLKKDTSKQKLHLYYYNLGWVSDQQDKKTDAISWYKKAAKTNPQFTNAFNNIGYAYDRLGKKDSAIYWYKQTIKIDPNYTRGMYNLAAIYNDLYQYDSSLYYYKMLYPLVPTDASVPYEIGLNYYYAYKYDSAIIYLEKAITVNNNKADYFAKAGDAYFDAAPYYSNKNALYQRAIDLYTSALQLDSTLYYTMNRLGVAYIYLEKFDEGISVFELALEKDALYKNTYEYNLACIYSLQQKPDKALAYFERSVVSGYRDLGHIAEDTDLDNIRKLSAFRTIIEKYFKADEIAKVTGLYGK